MGYSYAGGIKLNLNLLLCKKEVVLPKAIVTGFIKKLHRGSVSEGNLDPTLFNTTWKEVFSSFEVGYGKSLSSVKYNSPDWEYLQQVKYNSAVFSAFKQNTQIKDAARLLLYPDGTALSWREFRDKAMQIDDTYNKRYLQTEFNQAHNSALQARRWRDAEKTADLYPNLMYVAVQDDRTRESHKKLHGTILPITDPFWDKYTPPLDWGCRCSIRRTDKKATSIPGDIPDVAQGFDINPGKEARIFSDNHPYVKGSSDRANELMSFVRSQLRDVQSIKQSFAKFESLAPEWTKTYFDGNEGGWLVKHTTLSKEKELTNNIVTGKLHANRGKQVELLKMNSSGTSIDSKVNGIYNEYKGCSNTTSSIHNQLRDANRQARGMNTKSDVTITFKTDKGLHKLKKDIVNRYNASPYLDNLHIIIGNDVFGPYKRNDVITYKFL